MKIAKVLAASLLTCVFLLSLFPQLITGDASDEQFRNDINLAPGPRYLLGTDDLGRNRLTRLLSGTRTSLFLAPIAALASVIAAALVGIVAGNGGSLVNRLFEAIADFTASMPWLLLLVALRALLPLDAPPLTATAITFTLLAFLGWPGAARIIRNAVQELKTREFALQARALGVGGWRFSMIHLAPNIVAVAAAQFWINLPVFILTEANLGLLGMGVPEPYASLGNQLRDLQSLQSVTENPTLLAPAVLLTLVVSSLWIISIREERYL
ncbi:MAG: ABC transporter permease [Bryobacteraceae bacterium]|nr:ABC transporter permease [Bryobacteraceae bacterium]